MKMNPLIRKISNEGFNKAPKNRFLHLMNGTLTHEELILYELGVAIATWDPNYDDTYGSFKATNKQLAEIMGWKSDTQVLRHKKNLIIKGFFIPGDDGQIFVKDFDQWLLKKQNKSLNMQKKTAFMQDFAAKNEVNQPQNEAFPLVSSKGSIGSFREDKNGYIYIFENEIDRISAKIDEKNRLEKQNAD